MYHILIPSNNHNSFNIQIIHDPPYPYKILTPSYDFTVTDKRTHIIILLLNYCDGIIRVMNNLCNYFQLTYRLRVSNLLHLCGVCIVSLFFSFIIL